VPGKNTGLCGRCGQPLAPGSSKTRQYHPDCALVVRNQRLAELARENGCQRKSPHRKNRAHEPKAKPRQCLLCDCEIVSPYPRYCDKCREKVASSPDFYLPKTGRIHGGAGETRGA